MTFLDDALAQGKISKMDYLLERMRLVEEEADLIIKAHPEGSKGRLALQYDQRGDTRPRTSRKYRD